MPKVLTSRLLSSLAFLALGSAAAIGVREQAAIVPQSVAASGTDRTSVFLGLASEKASGPLLAGLPARQVLHLHRGDHFSFR